MITDLRAVCRPTENNSSSLARQLCTDSDTESDRNNILMVWFTFCLDYACTLGIEKSMIVMNNNGAGSLFFHYNSSFFIYYYNNK